MVKYTQTILQESANELFECVWPFCGIGAQGLIISFYKDLLVGFNFFKELAGGVENNFVWIFHPVQMSVSGDKRVKYFQQMNTYSKLLLKTYQKLLKIWNVVLQIC